MPVPSLGEMLRCVLSAHEGEGLLVEYPGYGESQGSPSLRALLDDADSIFRYVRDEMCISQRPNIVVMGRSIGSIAALEIARRYPEELSGVIIESGMDDPCEMLARRNVCLASDEKQEPLSSQDWRERIDAYEAAAGTADDAAKEAQPARVLDHLATLQRFQGKTTIIHCVDDETHRIEMARRLHAAALTNADSDLVEFETGGHNYIHPMNWQGIAAALNRALLSSCGGDKHDNDRRRFRAPLEDGSFWAQDGSMDASLARLGVAGEGNSRCAVS